MMRLRVEMDEPFIDRPVYPLSLRKNKKNKGQGPRTNVIIFFPQLKSSQSERKDLGGRKRLA